MLAHPRAEKPRRRPVSPYHSRQLTQGGTGTRARGGGCGDLRTGGAQMNYPIGIVKLLTATILIVGTSGGTNPVQAPAGQGPTTDPSTKNCENHNYPVFCYANQSRPHQPYFNCYSNMCDAAADGSFQCKKATGTCK